MVHVGHSCCLAERLQIRSKAMRRSIKGTGVWWYNSFWYIPCLFCSAKRESYYALLSVGMASRNSIS